MECHTCAYQAAVAAGRYQDVPFRQTPCGRCQLEEDSLHTWEFGDWQVGKEALVEDHPFPEEWDAEQESITNVLPVAVMVEALARLMSMPAKTRDLVCRRYQGESYASIARAENMSVSAVEVRHKRALATWPELRELFAVKCAKQVRRQAKKRRQQAGLRAGCRALRP